MAKILAKLEANVNNYASIGLNRAADRTKERLKQNAGITDHSLEKLAELGHPYAARGAPRIPGFHAPTEDTDGPEPWGNPVHIQSGKLYNSISTKKEDKNTVSIGADPNIVGTNGRKYLTDVIEGTALLVPRNFPRWTLNELIEEEVIYKTMEAAIKTAVQKS